MNQSSDFSYSQVSLYIEVAYKPGAMALPKRSEFVKARRNVICSLLNLFEGYLSETVGEGLGPTFDQSPSGEDAVLAATVVFAFSGQAGGA